jgi:AcrR family transcriptional regulator
VTHCHKGVDVMPKDTFFNLPEEKKQKILQSAVDEFTENEMYKSRVSNIIKNAGIPRGSFYQYFEDLEDLYFYVIEGEFDKMFKIGETYADTSDDLFEFSVNSFEYDYDAYTNDKRHQFMMNVMKSISMNEAYVQVHNKKRKEYILGILRKFDLTKVKLIHEDDLIKMYQMIQDVKRNVIRKSLIDNLSKEEAKKEIYFYIDILKHGLLKEE